MGQGATTHKLPPQGRLPQNIIYFCRTLRRAGVPVGPAQMLDTIRAVEAAGFTSRQDFFFTLRACLITRIEHLDVFERVFSMFWRDPEFLEQMIQTMLPMIQTQPNQKDPKAAEKRAADAMMEDPPPAPPRPEAEREETELDAQFSFSNAEKIGAMDFEQMSSAELAEAKAAIARMRLPIKPIRSRRLADDPRGRLVDMRKTLRQSTRTGGAVLSLARRAPQTRPPDLVALCDISGSMSVYSRLFMHFLHSVSITKGAGWARVHGFTFGTRLTNISRALSHRDPDAALNAVGREAQDWDGGTRIGAALADFNKHWARRVLGRGAVVLLVTDGLERDSIEELSAEARRLSLSARQIIWLNPLMRWDGFTPAAAGIRALLPHVDQFLSCHSLDSFTQLAEVLGQPTHNQPLDAKAKMMSLL